MKYLILALFTGVLMSAPAQAAETQNVFSCIQQQSLTVDPDCLSKTIELEQKLDQFNQQLKTFEVKNAFLDTGREMATLAYYPDLNLIRVIAERPEGAKLKLQTAMLDTDQ